MVAMPDVPNTTKRGYTGLDDYATGHGTTGDVYRAAGWRDGITRRGRPALEFPTATGKRYRLIDGEKPTYDQDVGYKKCWYGLQRAIKLATENDIKFLVDCNGAPSTVPAQFKGIPAFSLQAGEDTSPDEALIDEVKKQWQGLIIVAMDCDATGRNAAVKRVRLWRKAGFESYAVDLALHDGGDLADFAAKHDKPNVVLVTLGRLTI